MSKDKYYDDFGSFYEEQEAYKKQQELEAQKINCVRCNDNGCPACENIKYNIKD